MIDMKKIRDEVTKHTPKALDQMSRWCNTHPGRNRIALGKALANQFNLEFQAGVKIATAWTIALI